MQNKIQNRHDFNTKIKNDPIQLLKSIEEVSLSFDEMDISIDAIISLFIICEKEGKKLSSYKTSIAVAQLGGEILIHRIIGSG